MTYGPDFLDKLRWSLPWLSRYPLWRAGEFARRALRSIACDGRAHLILVVANHFEPSWDERMGKVGLATQLARVDEWCEQARATGEMTRDCDGTPFRHTYFYPAEQYHRPLVERLDELEADGLGEAEIHMHHGIVRTDALGNLRLAPEEFRDLLSEEHRRLSR